MFITLPHYWNSDTYLSPGAHMLTHKYMTLSVYLQSIINILKSNLTFMPNRYAKGVVALSLLLSGGVYTMLTLSKLAPHKPQTSAQARY